MKNQVDGKLKNQVDGTLNVNGTLKLMETQSANTKELEKAITFEKTAHTKLILFWNTLCTKFILFIQSKPL